jgi:hypothetical protein
MTTSSVLIRSGAVAALGVGLLAAGLPAEPVRDAALAATPAATPEQPSSVSGGGVTLRSVSVELPLGNPGFPGGGAAETITNDCTGCHSPGMVLTQPALPASAWQSIVDKMRMTYKAPIPAEDVPAIIAYLTRLSSTK